MWIHTPQPFTHEEHCAQPMQGHGGPCPWQIVMSEPHPPLDTLPPDLTLASHRARTGSWLGWAAACGSLWNRWHCTRLANHTRRHAAGNGRHILAVWP